MLGTWLGVLLSISACLSPAHSAGVVSPVLTPTPRAGSPRRLLARAGGAAIQAEDVRSTYGITLTGSLTPIHTAQHLATVLQSAAPGTRLALMPQVSVSPCEPLAVPAGAHVTLDCGGGSIDLRCDGAGMLLGTDAKLELLQCHVLWPVLRPLFTQPDSSIILEEGASITQLQGSSSLHCKATLGAGALALLGGLAPGTSAFAQNLTMPTADFAGSVRMLESTVYCMPRSGGTASTESAFNRALQRAAASPSAQHVVPVAGVLQLASAALWSNRQLPMPGEFVVKGTSVHASIDFARFPDIFAVQDITVDGNVTRGQLVLRNLRLASLPAAPPPPGGAPEKREGVYNMRFMFRGVTSMLWIARAQRHAVRGDAAAAVMVEDVEVVVECEEVAFLRRFAESLRSSQHGLSVAHADYQAVGDHTIHFSSLELPGLSATRYTVTCSSRPLVYLSPRTDLTGLSTPLAEHCADVLNALPAVTLGRESSLDAGAVAAIIAAIVGAAFVIGVALCLCWLRQRRCKRAVPRSGDVPSSRSDGSQVSWKELDTEPEHHEWHERSPRMKLSDASTSQPLLGKLCKSFQHDSHPRPATASSEFTLSIREGTSLDTFPNVNGAEETSAADSARVCTEIGVSAEMDASASNGANRPSSSWHKLDESPASSPPSLHERADSALLVESNRDSPATSGNPYTAPQPGRPDMADERLEIEGVLGGEGHGQVFSGSWRGLEAAIKTALFQVTKRFAAATEARVRHDAETAFNLSHANVVNTLSHEIKPLAAPSPDVAAFKLHIVQELCAGGSLANFLRHGHARSAESGLLFDRVLMVLRDVASGMAFVHGRQVAHGSLSPSTILLQVAYSARPEEYEHDETMAARVAAIALDNEQCTAKVANFGLGVQFREGVLSASNVKSSTPFYVAPELLDSSKLAPASDTFSFGVVMWEIFMGCPPYITGPAGLEQHPDFPSFPSHCPFNYAVLALACMAPSPEDRPPFFQIFEVLTSLDVELANGDYRDWAGQMRSTCELGALTKPGTPQPMLPSSSRSSPFPSPRLQGQPSQSCSSPTPRPATAYSSVQSLGSLTFYASFDAAASNALAATRSSSSGAGVPGSGKRLLTPAELLSHGSRRDSHSGGALGSAPRAELPSVASSTHTADVP